MVRTARSGSTVEITEAVREGGQGIVYRATTESGHPVAVKWIKVSPYLQVQHRAIARLTGYPRPHEAFAWPIDLVTSDRAPGFGYIMEWVPERFISLIELIDSPVQPTFWTIVGIARELVDAFARLHGSGLCYRDINFGNVRVDPTAVEVAIVDNDNVGPSGETGFVKGTLRFMAPEVICDKAAPSTETDLYSLAVILFYLLVRGHPLEGSRVRNSYTWNSESLSEMTLAVQHFGVAPLFVFDPEDQSNAPDPDDPMRTWWSVYPGFVRELFTRAFTTGLMEAAVGARVTESEWRLALVRLGDSIAMCSCQAAVVWDRDEPGHPCWSCGRVPPPPRVLKVPGHELVLAPGAVVTREHLRRDHDFRTVEGMVEAHPEGGDRVVLRNVGDVPWTVRPENEGEKVVDPGRRLLVRPMIIDFGRTRGIIRSAVT